MNDSNERKADKQVNHLKDGNSDKTDISTQNFISVFCDQIQY
jgi:ferritin